MWRISIQYHLYQQCTIITIIIASHWTYIVLSEIYLQVTAQYMKKCAYRYYFDQTERSCIISGIDVMDGTVGAKLHSLLSHVDVKA